MEYMKTSRPKYYLLEGIPRLYHGSECGYVRGIKTKVWHKDEDEGVGGRSNGTTHTIVYIVPLLLCTQGERECNHDTSYTNVNADTFSAFIITFVGERVVSE